MPFLCSIAKSKAFTKLIYPIIKLLSFYCNRKGYINNEDLKEVFRLLGETVTDDEVNSKWFKKASNNFI